jgi:hypothetical protein
VGPAPQQEKSRKRRRFEQEAQLELFPPGADLGRGPQPFFVVVFLVLLRSAYFAFLAGTVWFLPFRLDMSLSSLFLHLAA